MARLTRSSVLDIAQRGVRPHRARQGPRASGVVIAKHALQQLGDPHRDAGRASRPGSSWAAPSSPRPSSPGPGVGRLTVQALLNRDFPVVLAAVFVISVTYTLINSRSSTCSTAGSIPRTRRRAAARVRTCRRRHGLAASSGSSLARLVVVAALGAPWLVAARSAARATSRRASSRPAPPATRSARTSSAATSSSRVLYGARIALFIGFCTRASLTAVVGGLARARRRLRRAAGPAAVAHAPGRRAARPFRSSCWRSPSTRSWGSACATSS